MSSILDSVFAEVCLDERISDGVFRMDETEHMNALRDYFIKKGLTKEDAVHVTNRMIEGKYPDRQAYRAEDGILVTWPSQKHKQKAMRENPGKYVEQNPFPKKPEPHEPMDNRDRDKDKEKDTPAVEPTAEPAQNEPASVERPGASLFEPDQKVQQGNRQLSVEPVPGTPAAQAPQAPPQPTPKTPNQIAAEKEIVKQMIKPDGNSALTNIANPLNEAYRQEVIKELYKKANERGLKEVVTFLTPYVKP